MREPLRLSSNIRNHLTSQDPPACLPPSLPASQPAGGPGPLSQPHPLPPAWAGTDGKPIRVQTADQAQVGSPPLPPTASQTPQ